MVASSNLVIPTFSFFRDVAQPGSALRSGRRGRKFKSCHPDLFLSHFRKEIYIGSRNSFSHNNDCFTIYQTRKKVANFDSNFPIPFNLQFCQMFY